MMPTTSRWATVSDSWSRTRDKASARGVSTDTPLTHPAGGSAPAARADIEVRTGEQATAILLTITPLDGSTGPASAADAAEVALTQLAAALGGIVQARLAAFPWRARISLTGAGPGPA
jgi:hypothetical protein